VLIEVGYWLLITGLGKELFFNGSCLILSISLKDVIERRRKYRKQYHPLGRLGEPEV